MASRFGSSNLHQRDSRSALFEGYTGPGSGSDSTRRPVSASPNRGYGYGYPGQSSSSGNGNGTAAMTTTGTLGVERGGFRPATPNSKGQYSGVVLDELESQNDAQVEGIMGKVKILKDMTIAIGDEIRESSALAEKMNDTFTRNTYLLRGTMNKMMLMAERSGIGWKVWVVFFAAVTCLFVYVWLF